MRSLSDSLLMSAALHLDQQTPPSQGIPLKSSPERQESEYQIVILLANCLLPQDSHLQFFLRLPDMHSSGGHRQLDEGWRARCCPRDVGQPVCNAAKIECNSGQKMLQVGLPVPALACQLWFSLTGPITVTWCVLGPVTSNSAST